MKKIISIIVIATFLVNTLAMDLGWAGETMKKIRPAEVRTSIAQIEHALTALAWDGWLAGTQVHRTPHSSPAEDNGFQEQSKSLSSTKEEKIEGGISGIIMSILRLLGSISVCVYIGVFVYYLKITSPEEIVSYASSSIWWDGILVYSMIIGFIFGITESLIVVRFPSVMDEVLKIEIRLREIKKADDNDGHESKAVDFIIIPCMIFIGSFMEEILFRQAFYDYFSPSAITIALNSFLFSIYHYTSLTLFRFISRFVSSLLLSTLYLCTGNLLDSVLAHAGVNLSIIILAPFCIGRLNKYFVSKAQATRQDFEGRPMNRSSQHRRSSPAALGPGHENKESATDKAKNIFRWIFIVVTVGALAFSLARSINSKSRLPEKEESPPQIPVPGKSMNNELMHNESNLKIKNPAPGVGLGGFDSPKSSPAKDGTRGKRQPKEVKQQAIPVKDSIPKIREMITVKRDRLGKRGVKRPLRIGIYGDRGVGKKRFSAYFNSMLSQGELVFSIFDLDEYMMNMERVTEPWDYDWGMVREALRRKESSKGKVDVSVTHGMRVKQVDYFKTGITFDIIIKVIADRETRSENIRQRLLGGEYAGKFYPGEIPEARLRRLTSLYMQMNTAGSETLIYCTRQPDLIIDTSSELGSKLAGSTRGDIAQRIKNNFRPFTGEIEKLDKQGRRTEIKIPATIRLAREGDSTRFSGDFLPKYVRESMADPNVVVLVLETDSLKVPLGGLIAFSYLEGSIEIDGMTSKNYEGIKLIPYRDIGTLLMASVSEIAIGILGKEAGVGGILDTKSYFLEGETEKFYSDKLKMQIRQRGGDKYFWGRRQWIDKFLGSVREEFKFQRSSPVEWRCERLEGVEPMRGVEGKIFAVGDAHSDLRALRETFEGLGLIERKDDENGLEDIWLKKRATVILGGDIVESVVGGVDIINYVRYIREEAQGKRSKIIWLIGNNEIDCYLRPGAIPYLTPEYGEIIEEMQTIKRYLLEEIRNRRIVAAYEIGGKVFVHGLNMPQLLEELRQTYSGINDPPTFAAIANALLNHAVERNDFSNIIFGSRRKSDKINGIFNASLTDISEEEIDRLPSDLVVFHDPRPFIENDHRIPVKKGKSNKKRSITGACVAMSYKEGRGRAAVVFVDGRAYAAYPRSSPFSFSGLPAPGSKDIEAIGQEVHRERGRLNRT